MRFVSGFVTAVLLMLVWIDYSQYDFMANYHKDPDGFNRRNSVVMLSGVPRKLDHYLNSGYFTLPMLGRCSYKYTLVDGSLITLADYYGCDRFQILINRKGL